MKNFSSADCRCFKRQHFYGYIYLRCQQRLHTDPFVSATSQRWTDGQEPQATNIGGDNFWPLNEDQIQEFHEAAAEADKKMEELVGLGLLYTGMRNAELHHMRPDWLEYSDQGSLRIVIPIEEECIGGAGRSGKNNEDERNLHDRGGPAVTAELPRRTGLKRRNEILLTVTRNGIRRAKPAIGSSPSTRGMPSKYLSGGLTATIRSPSSTTA